MAWVGVWRHSQRAWHPSMSHILKRRESFEYEGIQSLEMAAQISVACASEFLRNPSMINFVADTDRSACQSRLLLQTNSDMSR
jgi:hypothetical protein